MTGAKTDPMALPGLAAPLGPTGRLQCTARSKRSGERCRAYPMRGTTVCITHGGKAPQVQAAARRREADERAAREFARFGQPVPVHPAAALLDLVHWHAGLVAYWRDVVKQIEAEGGHTALTWGVVKTERGEEKGQATNLTTEQAAVNTALGQLERASLLLADFSTRALKAGVEERRVKLAEQQGSLVAEVLQRIFDRLDLAPAQRELLPTVVPEELRRLTVAGEVVP